MPFVAVSLLQAQRDKTKSIIKITQTIFFIVKGLVRKRRNLRKAFVNKSCGQLYAGFVYESKKRAIPYEWGVLLSCSSDLQHSIQDFVKENPISSVAIYGVE